MWNRLVLTIVLFLCISSDMARVNAMITQGEVINHMQDILPVEGSSKLESSQFAIEIFKAITNVISRMGGNSLSKVEGTNLIQTMQIDDAKTAQDQMTLSGKIFVAAGASLFFPFFMMGFGSKLIGKAMSKANADTANNKVFPWINTIMFLASGSLWLTGFILLTNAITILGTQKVKLGDVDVTIPPNDLRTLVPLYMKIFASGFFVMQPLTALASFDPTKGIAWANLVGMILFHIANMIDFGFQLMAQTIDKKLVAAKAVFAVATSLLVSTNYIRFTGVNVSKIHWMELIGSGLLLAGSIAMIV